MIQWMDGVNLCYCDESGTGNEPIAVMTGIVVDAGRMHLTKQHWDALLAMLTEETGHQIVELHTRDFYAGNGVFRDIGGRDRAHLISQIFQWLADRKHHVVYASVLKDAYAEAFARGDVPDELNTVWRFLGFHMILAMQKCCQREKGTNRLTRGVADPAGRPDLVLSASRRGDRRGGRRPALRRRGRESRGVGRQVPVAVHRRRGREYAAELFYRHAPPSIRSLS